MTTLTRASTQFVSRLAKSWNVWLVMLVIGSVLPRLAASPTVVTRPAREATPFKMDGEGRPARAEERWMVRLDDGPPVGLIVGAAVCGDETLLVDSYNQAVHRVRLSTGRRVGQIWKKSDGTRWFSYVYGIAADCETGTVYIVDYTGVYVFNTYSATPWRHYQKPRNFVLSIGPPVLDRDRHALYVPGLWPGGQNGWFNRGLDQTFQGDQLGYRLDLETGATAPLLPGIEPGCWSSSPSCLSLYLDRVREPSPVAWLASQRASTGIALFDSVGSLRGTIDARSHMFREDGQRAPHSATLEKKVAWQERNSVIRGVYSFGENVVAVHSFNTTKNWKRGQQRDFSVFMNVYSLDGYGLLSDVRLPDLPVARDDQNLYVIHYGPGGRRRLGSDAVTLFKIPVASETQGR